MTFCPYASFHQMHPVYTIATKTGDRRDWKGCTLLGKDFLWRPDSNFRVATEGHVHSDFWANTDFLGVN